MMILRSLRFRALRMSLGLLTLVACFGTSGFALTISPEERLIRPYRGIAYTEGDVSKVRQEALKNREHSEVVERILKTAREWLARSDEEIISLVPKPGAAFAHGYAGDPKTGKSWPRAGTGDLGDLSRPGEIRSPHTGDVYGIQKPGERYYDPGDGWIRPEDGRPFYFKALWNSFVARKLHEGVDSLSLAYLLTGEPEAARKALLILDHLAKLRMQMPDYKCMIDSVRMAKTKVGFFCYQGNLANQRVINTALAFDLIAGSPAATMPSSADPKMTVFENIEKNYFDIYEREYYLDQRGSLTNHGTILFGNLIAQGVLFGKPDLLNEGIDALYAFIDSTINRDGDYLELAGGYGRLGRDYGSRLVALLNHYRPSNYPNAAEMPDPARFPYNLRVADEQRWYTTVVEMLYRLPVLGRYPQYGDVNPDRDVLLNKNNPFLDAHRRKYLRMYYHQTTRDEWKREIAALYRALPANKESRVEIEDLLLFGISQWEEIGGAIAKDEKNDSAPQEGSELMGGKALAILRSGTGENRRALFMRGGANGPHGHDDQMAIVPYGNGMVLAGVYGYASSETPDHLSWGSRAISHLTATINEDLPRSYLYKGFRKNSPGPAGSVTAFVSYAPAQFVEMRNPSIWAKTTGKPIADYRRTAWLVDVDDESYYFVDLFQIIGGETHDYPWNAPYAGEHDKEAFTLSGVTPEARDGVWTLASLSGSHQGAYWNQPGQSWGERLDGRAGVVKPFPGERNQHLLSGQKKSPLAPGNGYGMIWDVRAVETDKDWQAVWKLPAGFLRANFLNYDGMTVARGRSPTLSIDQHFNMVIARRSLNNQGGPLRSRFVNVVEVGTPGQWTIDETVRLPLDASGDRQDAVGVKVSLRNGATDYLIGSRTEQKLGNPAMSLSGRNGFARIDSKGELKHLMMSESTSVEAAGWKMDVPNARFESKIVSVDPSGEEGTIIIEGELPEGETLKGATLLIQAPSDAEIPYTHDEYLAIERVEKGPKPGQTTLLFRKQSLIVTRFKAETVQSEKQQIESRWPSENAGMPGTDYLQGRMIYSAAGKPVGQIKEHTKRLFEVTDVQGVQPGDLLKVVVAKAGDRVIIPTSVALTARDDGGYLLRTTSEVTLRIPSSLGGKLLVSRPDQSAPIMEFTAQGEPFTLTLHPAKMGAGEVILKPERP